MTRVRRLLGPPWALDVALAAALATISVLEVALSARMRGPLAVNLLLAAGYSAPLALRRRRPLAVTFVVLGSIAVMTAFFTPGTELNAPLLDVVTAAFAIGAHAVGRRIWAGLALLVAGLIYIVAIMGHQGTGDFLFPTCFVVLSWVAGRAVTTRAQLTRELHEAAARASEAHELELARAAADERRRISREMHDVIAHSMSVMVVQAGGARRILERDPQRAAAAAAQIERTGRAAMAEMRHLLGLLQLEDEQPALAPQPTLAELDALVARSRAAGLPVDLREEGQRRPLPAGLDLAAYRIVQEALTNALKHAGGAATVLTVRWESEALRIEVRDHGPGVPRASANGSTGGHGLVGMRERVRLYGGELQTGRAQSGGWRVTARLPLAPVGAAVR